MCQGRSVFTSWGEQEDNDHGIHARIARGMVGAPGNSTGLGYQRFEPLDASGNLIRLRQAHSPGPHSATVGTHRTHQSERSPKPGHSTSWVKGLLASAGLVPGRDDGRLLCQRRCGRASYPWLQLSLPFSGLPLFSLSYGLQGSSYDTNEKDRFYFAMCGIQFV